MRRKRGDAERESLRLSNVWRNSTHCLPLLSGLLLLILSGPTCVAQQNARNVLFIFSAISQEASSQDLFESALLARVPQHLNFHTSHVDYERMGDTAYQDSLAETFYHAYKNVKMDIVIVSSIEALQFVTHYRDKIFPGVPIVFYALSAEELGLVGQQLPAGITGRTSGVGLRETIDLALRLHPDVQNMAIVAAAPDFWWRLTRSEIDRHHDRVKEIDLFGLPGNEVLDKIAALPPHTVILFQLAPFSAKESDIKAQDVLTAAARRLPTYSAWPSLCLNYGCIGGAYADWKKDIALTADVAARVLSGERPENIPVIDDDNYETEVDWRELQRWHIPQSALPPGAVVLYRQPTLWESYRKYLIAAIVLILAQALLIAGLLWQRARKRKAEAVLRESERRFRVMADTTPSLVWMCDVNGKITYQNERRMAFTGFDPKVGWASSVHPDDAQNLLDTVSQALKDHKPFSTQYRLRRTDGVYRWMFDIASPRVNGDGSFAGFIGSAIDTTDQILAKQALEKMSGQLIEAQEQERSRIARELHDDICQRLALLSMEIEQTNLAVDGSPEETKRHLEEVGWLCREIGHDVQSLSHQLHSSILDCLGLVTAIRGFCDELSKQHDVSIDFTEWNVRKHLPRDVSLCLFRIAQEALHNALKYSGVSHFIVELSESAGTIQLLVEDRGEGFEVEEAKKKGGLGLVSMQERAHLIHGTFLVDSAPGKGTRILVKVPLGMVDQRHSQTTPPSRLQAAGL